MDGGTLRCVDGNDDEGVARETGPSQSPERCESLNARRVETGDRSPRRKCSEEPSTVLEVDTTTFSERCVVPPDLTGGDVARVDTALTTVGTESGDGLLTPEGESPKDMSELAETSLVPFGPVTEVPLLAHVARFSEEDFPDRVARHARHKRVRSCVEHDDSE